MPDVEVTVSCPVAESFRVQQVAGMFDVPISERTSETFQVEVPSLEESWQIGLIVGPSGSGKTTISRHVFGESLYRPGEWPRDRAIVDGFGEVPARELTALLTAVGFSSPPSWIKPYEVLSGGERFRCDLARALSRGIGADSPPLVAFDEFTSVVDRNVARIGSAAVSKAIRGGAVRCRFVAVTCHYDVAEWLEPDWTVDMATRSCQRRRLRRPIIELQIYRCRHAAWRMFARHHYLTGQLSPVARCFLALWQGNPVAFCATLPVVGRRRHWRISRVVTLPDYQGIGIGMGVAEAVADLHLAEGHRLNVTASHPALIAHCRRSSHWRAVRVQQPGNRRTAQFIPGYRDSSRRAVVSFEYLGEAAA